MQDSPPAISSFILRIIQTENYPERSPFRGTIRHIQTGREANFWNWQDIQEFVESFIPHSNDPST
jgi:hypothetical protein